MSEAQEQIQEIELSIEEAKKYVAFGDAIERLHANKDFREVILEGYFRDEASRLTLLLADQNVTEKTREHIFHSIQAIGELHGFFTARLMQREQMKSAIIQAQETIVEIQAEEDEA